MKCLIIYDSYFGNTEKVAQAIGSALAATMNVEVVRINDLKPEQLSGAEILIAGTPTRGFRASDAFKGYIKAMPATQLKNVKVAAFDTRIALEDMDNKAGHFFMKIFGYAAGPLTEQLKSKGGQVIVPGEGFYVNGTEGPLKDGELERAVAWAQKILKALSDKA
jgi:flavodoxin I